MTSRLIVSPAPYVPLAGLAIGREGADAVPVDAGHPMPVELVQPRRPTFRSGVVGFTPAALATDIIALYAQGYGRTILLEQVTISGTATSAAVIDVLIQRSYNGGGGTSATLPTARLDMRDRPANAILTAYSANRTSGGNGVDANRPLLGAGKLHLGSATTPGNQLHFRFDQARRPLLRDLNEWLVLNLVGQTIPAGCQLNVMVEWSEVADVPVQFAGDSTTSNATQMFAELANSGLLPAICNFNNSGSNGYRLQDALLNTNSIPYPLVGGNGILQRLGAAPGVLVLCFGINDMRQGLKTRAELVSMIDAAIYATLNGTVAGATYTSPMGAGTAFTWPATIAANPDARIVLWGPNSLTTDGNGAGYVTLTGRFATGYTLAQAAQAITDDLREAYEAFRDDPRVFRLVQKQDDFGRTSRTVAESGLMQDILHPNARGQVLSARQIAAVLRDAVASARAVII